jgi:hypothetical protein
MSAEDIALGYKQLLEVVRWLALLLVRVAGNTAGQTWTRMRRELDRIHIGTFTGPAGTFRQATELTKPAHTLLRA